MDHKVVVFDIDETLGFFIQFGVLWSCLCENKYIDSNKKQEAFNECFALYPEFMRPFIVPILEYLYKKQKTKECKKVMIYTNNKGPADWIPLILSFFEEKIGGPLFSNIIGAFKKKGKQIELGRTSHKKSYADLIQCSKISLDTQICFIDDTYYPAMTHDNIFYIKVKPYVHMLPYDEMIRRFTKNKFTHIDTEKGDIEIVLKEWLTNARLEYEPLSKEEYEIDTIVSKQMMLHIQEFLP
jgi:hypothetical protein